MRDTVFMVEDEHYPSLITGCGYTVVRLVADSPGVWPVHCHQSWHFLMGKAALLYYDAQEIATPNVSDINVCGDLTPMDVMELYADTSEDDTTTDDSGYHSIWKIVAIVCVAVLRV